MIILLLFVRRVYTEEEKNLIQIIYNKSPSAYKCLRAKIPQLPSIESIKRWRTFDFIGPGPNSKIIAALKSKVLSLDELHRVAIVIFDEMSIAQSLRYDFKSDKIIGKRLLYIYICLILLYCLVKRSS